MNAKIVNEKPDRGTPTYLLVSIVCAIVVFALTEIHNSFALGDAFSMRSVLMGNIGLGLTLAFFWKRLEKSPLLKVSAYLYLFGLWVSLFTSTLAPILLDGEAPLLKNTIVQQFGFVFIIMSGLSLLTGLVQNRKMDSGLLMSSMGALGLVLTSGGSLIFKSQQNNDDVVSTFTHSGAKEGALKEKIFDRSDSDKDGEDMSAPSAHKAAAQPNQAEGSRAHETAKLSHDDQDPVAHSPGEGDSEAPGTTNQAAPGHDDGQESDEIATGQARKRSAKNHGEGVDSHHEPAPVRAGPSVDDMEKPLALLKAKLPSRKRLKSKVASLDHAFSATAARSKIDSKDHEVGKGHAKAAGKTEAWAYHSGAESPEHWGELSDQFRTCSIGQQQSPIDIPSAWPLLSDVSIDYKLTSVSIVDNGHTIQFNVGDKNFATIAGKRYKLMQFHIHTPSEHWMDGRLSAMEIHFVHKDEHDQLAVIGVMVEPGQEQKTFGELWGFVPQGVNLPASPRNQLFNIASLMPKAPKVYRYRGSLTTPPCSENVLWSVADESIRFSSAQIEAFKTRYKNNARPLQKRSASLKSL